MSIRSWRIALRLPSPVACLRVAGLVVATILVAAAPAAAQATFTVNTPSDEALTAGCAASTGDCSLRGALQEANATANLDASTPDRIEFDIDGSGPHVIAIGSLTFNDPLPAVTEAVVIDGTTEPDYDAANGTPSIVLDATDAFGGALRLLNHDGSIVTGLSLVDADATSGAALTVRDGTNHTVRTTWIGVRPDGSLPGAEIGLEVEDASGLLIEKNVIRGSRASGIVLFENDGGSVRNQISQNAIYGHGFTAIDLGDDGLTPNDGSSDTDDGANDLINKPVLASSSYDGTTLTVTYEVPVATTAAAYPLTVEFFEADATGQPKRFLGADTYSGGSATASIADGSLPSSAEIVATATDANGQTSEVGVTLPPAATTYTVTTPADSGPGSLRRAIRAANNDPADNTIAFNISGTGPHTIQPGTPLPQLYGPFEVDATTEPDYAPGVPAVVIDGSTLTYRYGWGLKAEAGGVSAIRGLSIVNVSPGDFSGTGLLLVDTDRQISSSDTFEVTGCFFGVLPDGVTAAPNWIGLSLDSWYTVVGGTTSADRIIASGNEQHGIEITPGVDATAIVGSYIGVAADGVTALGNGDDGIHLSNSGSTLPDRIVIGGTNTGAGNIIAANGDDGIHLHADEVDVFGNRIGVNANDDPLGNADEGIRLYYGASDNRIGDVSTGAGNVIAHNGANGVFLPYNGRASATTTAIRGNSIYLNGALGIGLGGEDGTDQDGDGVSRNDVVPSALSGVYVYENDEDVGANQQQNTPVITGSTIDLNTGTLTVTYRVPSDPTHAAYPLTVDFYEAQFDVQGTATDPPFGNNDKSGTAGTAGSGSGSSTAFASTTTPSQASSAKATGYNTPGAIRISEAIRIPVSEGRTYLASDTYTATDYSNGEKTVTLSLVNLPSTEDAWINGTATDDNGNTSEFNFPFYIYTWSAGGTLIKSSDPPG